MQTKRKGYLILAVVILLSCLQITSSAEEQTPRFSYDLEDGEAILTRLDDEDQERLSELVIPEEIDGYVVTGLGSWFVYSGKLRTIMLPATLKTMASDAIVNNELESIQVADGNKWFQSIEGVLFQREPDGNLALHTYPGGKETAAYTVPDGVTAILPRAFQMNRRLSSLELTESVVSIGAEALSFASISELILPEGLLEVGEEALAHCNNMQHLKLPASLRSIGNGAFAHMVGLQGIELPAEGSQLTMRDNGLLSADGKHFIVLPHGSGNTAYHVPEGVEAIDNGAFGDHPTLTSISLPEGLITIGARAFAGLPSLREAIVIPSSVRQIGAAAFEYYNQPSLILPEGLQSIENSAFNNSALTSIHVPDSVTQLDHFAFSDCASLAEAKLPAGIQSVRWGLFTNCLELKKVIIPKGVTNIDGGAFYGCKDLTIHVPDSLSYIEEDAFDSDSGRSETDLASITLAGAEESPARQLAAQMGLSYVVDVSERYVPVKGDGRYTSEDARFEYDLKGGEATIASMWNQGAKKVTVPSEIDGYPVVAIGAEQDADSEWITAVLANNDPCRELVLPDGILRINAYAFIGLDLEKINLPQSLLSIGESAFHMSKVKLLQLPEKLEGIGVAALASMEKLTKISVAEENPHYEVADGLLYDKRNGTLVVCPAAKSGTASVREGTVVIAPSAFSGCGKITQVKIPESVSEIGEMAFAWCYKLAKVNLPAGLQSLPEGAFHMTSSLTSIQLPEGLTSIGKQAFYENSKLKSIQLPATLESIGARAFAGNGLTAFEVAADNLHFAVQDGVLFSKDMRTLVEYPAASKAKEYVVPSGVVELSEGAFSNCKNLKKITLPEGMTAIPYAAFAGDRKTKTEVALPKSLQRIDEAAFNNAVLGDRLEIPEGVTSIGQKAFDGAAFKTLVLPEGLVEIGEYSFRWNTQLTSIVLPSTLTRIPAGAFEGCTKLTEITGVEHLVAVDETAFQNCPKLKTPLPGR